MNLANKFHFNADEVFDEVEKAIRSLQANLAATRDELRALRAEKQYDHPHPIGYRWTYDAADPVYFTDVLSEVEEIQSGVFKRWVLGDGPLTFALRLRRDLSYIVVIEIADMAAGAEFCAAVDGHPVPLQLNNKKIRFVVPQNMDAFQAGSGLTLTFNSDAVHNDGSGIDYRVLRFSLRGMTVMPIELCADHPLEQR